MSIQKTVIGIDLGGTKTALALYDAEKLTELDLMLLATKAERGFIQVYDDLVSAIQSLRKDGTTEIGIGVPGLVRHPQGMIVKLPNISGAEGRNLSQDLLRDTGLRAVVDNDANCFALAEAIQGEGRGESVVIGITLGTGVGGGIIIDGKIFHGHSGFAAEIGHMLLRPGEPPYETDDRRGDVEQFLSGTAMGYRCRQAQSPAEYLEGQVCGFLQPAVFREVAWMCVSLTHLLDPSVIVFGGSAGRALNPHLKDIESEIAKWILQGTPIPRLAISQLEDGATRGAAMLTQDKLHYDFFVD